MLRADVSPITNQDSEEITGDNETNSDLRMKVGKAGFNASAMTEGVVGYLKNTETIDPLHYWQFILAILFSSPSIFEIDSMTLLSDAFLTSYLQWVLTTPVLLIAGIQFLRPAIGPDEIQRGDKVLKTILNTLARNR